MSRSRKTAAVAGIVAGGALALSVPSVPPSAPPSAVAHGRDAAPGRLVGAAVIAPGREGIVKVLGHPVPSLAAGATLRLTAPDRARVTGTPLDVRGYRGAVAADGRSGTYTVTGTPAERPWSGRGFPFVLAVSADAVPGTRLRGCTLRLTDQDGRRRGTGRCEVTVGLAGPTLTRPQSGVPLGDRPEISGTAHPGARVTVRDKDDNETCTATAGPDGTWRCTPAPGLPTGANRLQAIATLNGVSALSEQIQITVADAAAGP